MLKLGIGCKKCKTITPSEVKVNNTSGQVTISRTTMYRGSGLKISGVGATIEFDIEGDELSIAQFIP